jgi:hypothetical protein
MIVVGACASGFSDVTNCNLCFVGRMMSHDCLAVAEKERDLKSHMLPLYLRMAFCLDVVALQSTMQHSSSLVGRRVQV